MSVGCVFKTVEAFHDAPAVVLAAGVARGLEVNLLEAVLAHVADEEIAGQAVAAEAPGVAQSERPDFGAEACAQDEGVACGNGVGVRPAGLDVEAQDFAGQLAGVLRAVAWVAA